MHGPTEGDGKFKESDDFDRFATALLITWDLMHPRGAPLTSDDAVEELLQDLARFSAESIDVEATRVFFAYQLGEKRPAGKVLKLREAFSKLTT